MLINTAVFGQMDVREDNIIHLPDGLYGFEQKGDFAIIEKQDDDVTLMWLQAVDSNVPCFVVFDPFEIIDGYQPVLDKSDMGFLEASSPEDLVFFVIAVVPDDMTKITVNLKSPVVVNKHSRKARQVILSNSDYPIRFPLFEE